jgi:putative tricarboxylic transport membrane protein
LVQRVCCKERVDNYWSKKGVIYLAYYEAGPIGVAISITVAVFGGILNRYFGIHTGVQFMTYYASGYLMLTLFGIK